MVQKEVAERLTALSGTKNSGAITYSVYYYSEPEVVLDVESSKFIPAPEVDSQVIKLNLRKKPVKEGGPDPAGNSKLKNVIAKCKAANMPNDTINNAIKKASSSNENYEELTYEGYGTGGVAVIVKASTDNKNRTAADVRHVFDKAGGNLGTNGCVSYMFESKGVIIIEKENCPFEEDDLMMIALEAGAEDFSSEDEVYEIKTAPNDFTAVTEALTEKGLNFLEAGIQMIPSSYIKLDETGSQKMQRSI